MRPKPQVRKLNGRWTVIRPGYGFRPEGEVIPCTSHQEALNYVTDVRACDAVMIEHYDGPLRRHHINLKGHAA